MPDNYLNCFEESTIKNHKLHEEWQDQATLHELELFLQANWEQRSVLYNDEKLSSRQQFLSFQAHGSIRTNNYIGTVVFRGKQLNIFPKVFREDVGDDDTEQLSTAHMMKNIVKWIGYCNRISYPFLNISSELEESNNLRELFITLYIHCVRRALEYAPYYRYEDQKEDLGVIRGKIDFKDYINNKIPNGLNNKFSCNYSEFNFNNQVNQIIKYTCKCIQNSVSSAKDKKSIRYILTKLGDIEDKRCTPSDCDAIRFPRTKEQYSVIMSMSKMFLLNQVTSYQIDNQNSFCFLFPTELLFEGFIGGFIKELVSDKASVRLQASEKKLVSDIHYAGNSYGSAYTMRHDILVDHKKSGLFVLDTKYKQMPRFADNPDFNYVIHNQVSQDDLYQIAMYAEMRDTDKAYLLYPMYRFEEEEPEDAVLDIIVNEKTIKVHVVRMPFVFEADAKKTTEMLKKTIGKIFGI